MRLGRGAALAALALVLCCLGKATSDPQVNESQDTDPQAGGKRVLRKTVRGTRRVRPGAARPGRDIGLDSHDDGYQTNLEHAFRGNAYRDLEVRGFTDSRRQNFGDSRNRNFASDVSNRAFTPDAFVPKANNRGLATQPRDRAYSSEPGGKGFASESFAPEAKGYNPNQDRAEPDLRDSRKPSNYRPYESRDSATDIDVRPTSRNFGAPSTRDPDASRGRDGADRYDPIRLKDYYSNSGDSKSSDSQRWLKILAEFLRSSSEGRELLRARADQLLVGADVEAGQLPLPLLLVPVPVQDQQCIAPNPEKVSDPRVKDVNPTLLALFREDEPRAPLLPPMLLPDSPRPVPAEPLPPISSAPPPSRLRFDRSLVIRAELTVYYSDYTEPYTVWYDADTGSSRVDMHGGTTVLYRTVQPGGEVVRTQLRIERYEDDEKRACARLTSSVVDADRSPPGLPDTEPFSFSGYQDTVDGRMERWTYTLAGQVGELGAARGEALVFRHELLVARIEPDFAIPYKYRVTVDSSVLGPEVDWYEHRYLEVREQRLDPSYMSIDVERECDSVTREHRIERVDPLREFVMTHRDTRCDTDFEKYKETYEVNYKDVVEEAVRKTMLIRRTRFVESGNRQGSPALLGVNRFSVLLPAERRLRMGIEDNEGSRDNDYEPFPLSPEEVARAAAELPAVFSWKKQGAVTHVRNQGGCSTCWAFAVVVAVEGALFRRTGQLVPLSDQQLADCTPGPTSCQRGKYVINPYERVRDAGIVALGDYPRYNYHAPMVEQCRKEDPVVTKISGFVKVTNSSDALKVSIVKNGPNVVVVDGMCESLINFMKGLLVDKRCNPNARSHALTAIGFGKHKRYGAYFILKNSWGTGMGRKGFVHLHAPTNTAGVHTHPSYPRLAEEDVLYRGRLASLATQYPDEGDDSPSEQKRQK